MEVLLDAQNLSQDEIKRQIALLQQRLNPEDDTATVSKSPKRKSTTNGPQTLVPATPSPSSILSRFSSQTLTKM